MPPPMEIGPPASVEAPTPARAGGRRGAAVVLILIGLASAVYNAWDLALLIEDLEIFDLAGVGWVGIALLAIDGVLIVSGLLQLIGGARILATRYAGGGLGMAGSVGTVLAWVAFLVVAVSADLLGGVSVPAWVMLLISVSGSVLAGGLLLVGREPLAPPGPEAA
ncbi:MAG: hypothetical protein ACRDHJ_05485 [Actinomycetota bacterium]